MPRVYAAKLFILRVSIILLGIGLFIACRNDEKAVQADAPASAEISRINQQIAAKQKLTQKDIDSIREIYARYPQAKSVRQTLQTALISREDWGSLEKLLLEIPAGELTREDKTNLGKVYLKLGRYGEAADTLRPLEDGSDPEIRFLLANAYFNSGSYDEAKKLLDDSWENIISEKRVSEMTFRGMIYFYQNEPEKAAEILRKVIEIDPANIAALNGLSRIYGARGDREKAEEYLARVQQTFDRVTAEERRRTKFVETIYKLKEAYQAQRFEEVIELANQAIPEADAANRAALYQYLYNSYRALGRQKEAQEALAKANQTQ